MPTPARADAGAVHQLPDRETDLPLNLADTGGDGWQGASYRVYNASDYPNVVETPSTMVANGTPLRLLGVDWLCLADGCYEIVVDGGAADSEIGRARRRDPDSYDPRATGAPAPASAFSYRTSSLSTTSPSSSTSTALPRRTPTTCASKTACVSYTRPRARRRPTASTALPTSLPTTPTPQPTPSPGAPQRCRTAPTALPIRRRQRCRSRRRRRRRVRRRRRREPGADGHADRRADGVADPAPTALPIRALTAPADPAPTLLPIPAPMAPPTPRPTTAADDGTRRRRSDARPDAGARAGADLAECITAARHGHGETDADRGGDTLSLQPGRRRVADDCGSGWAGDVRVRADARADARAVAVADARAVDAAVAAAADAGRPPAPSQSPTLRRRRRRRFAVDAAVAAAVDAADARADDGDADDADAVAGADARADARPPQVSLGLSGIDRDDFDQDDDGVATRPLERDVRGRDVRAAPTDGVTITSEVRAVAYLLSGTRDGGDHTLQSYVMETPRRP